MAIAGLLALSYLLGAVPTGYLVVRRLRGIDIRRHGSGNPGTANVYRVAGPWPGALTLLVDAGKGCLPVLLAERWFPGRPLLALAAGAAAIFGHDWTVFLGFKGGKGVATSAGVFAALMPRAAGCAALAFVAGFAITGHISVGSMSAALALPLGGVIFGYPAFLNGAAAAAAALIVFKHLPNIKRLRQGKELFLNEKK